MEQLPDEVILVDEADRELGTAEKLSAHQNGGRLHRAFSIFIFNSTAQMLLQKRSRRKYHFGGLWTNACCGHPRPGELMAAAARARLREEFGFDTDLRSIFRFNYRALDRASGLTENEIDHVFCGQYDGQPAPNPGEIDECKWMNCKELTSDVQAHPERYSPWFCIALPRVLNFE